MYRLIAPVIDYANESLGLKAYFEFNQTSAHGTSQSVDIALLDGLNPVVMVEAKRLDRRIAAEQISKYLPPGVRGVVSNGQSWVMCIDGSSKAVSLCQPPEHILSVTTLDEIVGFVRGGPASGPGWSTEGSYVDPLIVPGKPAKESKAHRISNPVQRAVSIEMMRREFGSLAHASNRERLFLATMAHGFEQTRGIPGHLRCEVRSSRVAFFDERRGGRSQRVGRIELGKQHPDILVLTELLGPGNELSQIAMSTPHDKGPHMRRFRLGDDSQTQRFAEALVRVFCR